MIAQSTKKTGRPRGSKWSVPESMAKKWVTTAEACQLIGCSPRTLFSLIGEDRLVSIKYLDFHRLILRTSIALLIATETGTGL